MKKGLGTLLGIVLAVAVFKNPSVSSTLPQSKASTHSNSAEKTTTSSKDEITITSPNIPCPIDIEKDPSCAKCTEACPARELLESFGAYYGEDGIKDFQHLKPVTDVQAPIKFVLAILPDPVHTHLSLFFDRSIDAIEQAAQASGYIFTRSTMPWDTRDYPKLTDLNKRDAENAAEEQAEKLPGLMIFRKSTPQDRSENFDSLFVFVVGETPTGGIHKSQFENALKIVRTINGGRGSPSWPNPLLILGPTFSGSLYSLGELLSHTSPPGLGKLDNGLDLSSTTIHVRSGSISSWETLSWFDKFRGRNQKLDLISFYENDRYSLTKLIDYLHQSGFKPCEVALLSEDETAYGTLMPSTSALENCSPYSTASPNDNEAQIVHMYFPREISQLRSAYQKGGKADDSAATGGSLTARKTLRLDLEDTRNDDESVSTYSKGQTPLSQESELLGIVRNLQKHRVRFIVLRATDPLDLFFLCQILRTAYPEGRIVTLGSDLLFAREVDNPRFDGIMAVTSYSLLPGSDDQLAIPSSETGQGHVDRIFPWSLSAGTYNAMLALLKSDGSAQGSQNLSGGGNSQPSNVDLSDANQDDLPVAPYSAYGWPCLAGTSCGRRLLAAPLWLTVLGRDGAWPLALLDGSGQSASGQAVKSSLHTVGDNANVSCRAIHLPLPWKILFTLCTTLVGVYLILLRRGSLLQNAAVFANFAPFNVPARNWVFFIADLLLLLVLLALSWPWVRWTTQFVPFYRWFGCLILAIGVLTVSAYCDLRRRRAKKISAVFIIVAALAIGASVFLSLRGPDDPSQNFMMYRYVHITSGVSPLVPWLFLGAAGLWWVWQTLAGLALLDDRKPCLPKKEDLRLEKDPGDSSSRGVESLDHLSFEDAKRLVEVLAPTKWDWRVYVPALLIALLPGVALQPRHPVQSLEGTAYDIVYGLALAFVIFLVISGLLRLIVIWLEFRNLLTSLDRFPLRRSFARLDGFNWKPIWRLGGTALQDTYRLISREFDSLDHLWNLPLHDVSLVAAIRDARTKRRELGDKFRKQSKRYEEACVQLEERHSGIPIIRSIEALLRTQPAWVADAIQEFHKLQLQLAATCAAALKYLSSYWDSERTADLFEASNGDSASKQPIQPKEPLLIQLLEQFVCLFYVNFILSILLRMRTLALSAGGLFVFILLSFGSYPFEPKRSFHALMILLFLFFIGTIGTVLAQMHRNATLSRITNTVPGELGLDFWIRLISFIAVPLLSLLASQFPDTTNALFSWLQPALQAIK